MRVTYYSPNSLSVKNQNGIAFGYHPLDTVRLAGPNGKCVSWITGRLMK